MASISKFIPGIASGSLDIQPALANINFDFSLWKVAAPKEFEGVGSALSTSRREEAEDGKLHVIARKLGALFESKAPAVPCLTKAYGTRASEIAQVLSLDDQGRRSYGVFASHAGPDATSLWAAATSGGSAISIHLLACLLARIWDAPQAISIWVEIIKKRKEEVNAEFEESNIGHIATLQAARQDLARAQIAEWDDSARAWLRSANEVKKKQQTQLMLIIDNVQVPVNGERDTYASVMDAWKNSLTQMEALVKGVSQKAVSGEILLALSAWHLFPDLMVVTPSVTHVRQNDAVFHLGGILTLGLPTPSSDEHGIHWSLPLAHLRHYGAPVVSSRSISSESGSRLNVQELLQATLGSLLQSWGKAGKDTARAAKWMSSMFRMMTEATRLDHSLSLLTTGVAEHSWFVLLSGAANRYTESMGLERQHNNKLISLGRKQAKTFLGTPSAPLFGMLEHGRFVSLITNEEDKIAHLRTIAMHLAQKMPLDSSKILIRYKHRLSDSRWVYEYATAIPLPMANKKRKVDRSDTARPKSHCRWLYSGCQADYSRIPSDLLHWFSEREDRDPQSAWRDHCDFMVSTHDEADFEERRRILEAAAGETVFRREEQFLADIFPDVGIYCCDPGDDVSCLLRAWYTSVYGAIDDAALFVSQQQQVHYLIQAELSSETIAAEMYSLAEGDKLDSLKTSLELEMFFRYGRVDVDPHLRSLKALSTAARLYSRFSHASVDVGILQQSLYQAGWTSACSGQRNFAVDGQRGTPEALQPYKLSDEQAFACLAMFESGSYDINPNKLRDVIAMCSGHSIFFRAALLADPSEPTPLGDIQDLLGNIGRSGIAFLVLPETPLCQEKSLDDWPYIEHNEFDGSLQDNFKVTSLHLSFTEAETPLGVNILGSRDQEVFVLETLFSVYDDGRWIADLNFSHLFDPRPPSDAQVTWIPACTVPHHAETPDWRPRMICVDSWLGLINAPEERVSLLRAHRNWQARLAASSISLALGHDTIILPNEICWHCAQYIVNQRFRNVILIG
ncbi:MAG: hypothetical protein LQ346_004411 [Caloplaca aetnensis]|nr:MAG: hypothetical protein LQ346_004411 [Caloplaca aetnensis]